MSLSSRVHSLFLDIVFDLYTKICNVKLNTTATEPPLSFLILRRTLVVGRCRVNVLEKLYAFEL